MSPQARRRIERFAPSLARADDVYCQSLQSQGCMQVCRGTRGVARHATALLPIEPSHACRSTPLREPDRLHSIPNAANRIAQEARS